MNVIVRAEILIRTQRLLGVLLSLVGSLARNQITRGDVSSFLYVGQSDFPVSLCDAVLKLCGSVSAHKPVG